jgi:hypothetical protein
MNHREASAVGLGAVVLALALGMLASVDAQAPRADRAAIVARTSDGKPDLQGTWSNATLTPLERPGDNSPLVLSQEAVARLEKGFADRVEQLAESSDPNRPAPPKGGDGSTGAAGNVGGYNNFWIDPGDRVAVVNGEYRSSLIVDPPNGKVPALTTAARQRAQQRLAAMAGRGQYDHPEFRPLAERCLMSFGSNAGPPMLPNYFYNNNYQIVQTRDHVMILTEMVHDVRVIRMAQPGSAPERLPKHVRLWMGDSIGRWDGDTLVVETTNFHPLQQFRGASENLKVTERFNRADADTILYKFTIEDPTTFVSSWSGEVPFKRTDELIYEYACHEGNYALANVLSGERDRERREAARKKGR